MSHVTLAQPSAEVYLTRALGFVEQVEKATEEFRNQAIAHDARIDAQVASDAPFLATMISSVRSKRQLTENKTALWNDLQLAEQEISRAAAVDVNATVSNHTAHLALYNCALSSCIVGAKSR